MEERFSLAQILAVISWIIVAAGLAFMAGVWCGEHQEPEQVPLVEVLAGEQMLQAQNLSTGDPSGTEPLHRLSAVPLPLTGEVKKDEASMGGKDGGEIDVPDICEDTYLREDVPMSFEDQMHLYGACLEFQIDYALMLGLIEQECGFAPRPGDGGQAYGFCQVQRRWHEARMAALGVTDLSDPQSNFRVACCFLRELLDRYGNLTDALTFYNSGSTVPNGYAEKVLARAEGWGYGE